MHLRERRNCDPLHCSGKYSTSRENAKGDSKTSDSIAVWRRLRWSKGCLPPLQKEHTHCLRAHWERRLPDDSWEHPNGVSKPPNHSLETEINPFVLPPLQAPLWTQGSRGNHYTPPPTLLPVQQDAWMLLPLLPCACYLPDFPLLCPLFSWITQLIQVLCSLETTSLPH